MTIEELAQIQIKIDGLKARGFYDCFINEVLGAALRRFILIGGNYLECFEFTLCDELSQCEFAVIGEDDTAKHIDKNTN